MQVLGGEHSRQGTASAKALWQAGALRVWVTARRPVWPACREEVRRGRRWGWGAPGGHESCTCPIPPQCTPLRVRGPRAWASCAGAAAGDEAPPRASPELRSTQRRARPVLTHLHVLRREAREGLQSVVHLVALPPLHVLVVV